MQDVVISGTGIHIPSESITTNELVASFNTYVERYNQEYQEEIARGIREKLEKSASDFIIKASGIQSRYVIDKKNILDPQVMHPKIKKRKINELSFQAEMAVSAAKEALKNANKTAADINMVVIACSNTERPYPAISIEVQHALGINGFAFDANVACSSASFGINFAYNAILSEGAKCVLVISPELYTGHLNFRDRKSHFIFGDGCGAMVIENKTGCTSAHPYQILGRKLQTFFSNNIRNNFGFLSRYDTGEHTPDNDHLFMQQGKNVREDIIPLASTHIADHLSQHSIAPEDIKRLWLHQANININQAIGRNIFGRKPHRDELPLILEEYGNIGAAGSIITFHLHHTDLHSGDVGVFCTFGAGYSVGSAILKKL